MSEKDSNGRISLNDGLFESAEAVRLERSERRYMGEWLEQSESFMLATSLYVVYYVQCDDFDDGVCTGPTGPFGDGRLPANPHQAALINKHAISRTKELLKRARISQLSQEDLVAARRCVRNYSKRELYSLYENAKQLIEKCLGSFDL